MGWISGARARLEQLFRRAAADARADEEFRFHLEMETEKNLRAGMSQAEARRRAILAFGAVEGHREALRDGRRVPLLEDVARDVRLAARSLRRSPGTAVVAAGTLALAVGSATAMFSVLDGVLLRDLPVREPDELVVLWTETRAGESDRLPVPYRDLAGFRERSRALEAVAGVAYYGSGEMALRDGERTLTAGGTVVTGDLFPVLGVAPVLGRTLLPSDDLPGAEPVMVIGQRLWQRHFGGDPSAVGRTLAWNGKRFRVVGVLPHDFTFPHGAEVWVPVLPVYPATLQADAPPSETMLFDVVGRLRPGSGARAAREEYARFLREGDAARPPGMRGMQPVVTPLREVVVGDLRATLWTASAAVGLLLLIACVNVANLLLIRGTARARELAIRTALGARRGRLVRQLLTESAVLALLGGALGVPLAWAAVRALTALAPMELRRREMIEVDGRVLLFALAVTAAAALLSGLLPALLSAAGDPGDRLRGGGRTAAGHHGTRSLRHGLVVGQVALAMVVVAGAGLLVRSLVALEGVAMGFNDERLLVLQTAIPPGLVPERSRQVALQEEVLARVSALPAVAGAAAVPARPFSGQGGWTAMYSGEGQAPEAQAANPWVNFEVVGPEYVRTLEIPLVRGRTFGEGDREGAPPVAMVSEAVARHTWPGEDPLGKRIKLGPPGGAAEWHTVVGVVGETRYRALAERQPTLYLPIRQFPGPVPMGLAVRTRTDPTALVGPIRRVLREVHPDLLLVGGGPVDELVAAPLARPRFGAWLLGTFAVVTLLLATVGIYGTLAATVRQRTREIGIRLALGATGREVWGLVLRQGMGLALAGCALGMAGALLGSRVLRGMLFGIGPDDPATFAAVAALTLGAAVLACCLPALRASRVDPVTTLRAE